MILGMDNERDIVYSQAIKAGKRIYYLDVKRNKRNELFLSITESKKKLQGEGLDAPFTFEKHKIFLYQEDFSKFIEGLSKAIGYIHANQPLDERFVGNNMPVGEPVESEIEEPLNELDGALDIQIDFE